jgi:hypothetical protein
MEKFKKSCNLCQKDYETIRKQQRYCSLGCSYRAKNKSSFNTWMWQKERVADAVFAEGVAIRRSRPENESAGLNLDRERYSE